MDADVVVVGGGPAGGMAAWHLAPHCRVLLLERHRLPREKLCSGVLTAKAVAMLRPAIDLEPVLVGRAETVHIAAGGRAAVHRPRSPLAAGATLRALAGGLPPARHTRTLAAVLAFQRPHRLLARGADPVRLLMHHGPFQRAGWPWLVEGLPAHLRPAGLGDATPHAAQGEQWIGPTRGDDPTAT